MKISALASAMSCLFADERASRVANRLAEHAAQESARIAAENEELMKALARKNRMRSRIGGVVVVGGALTAYCA